MLAGSCQGTSGWVTQGRAFRGVSPAGSGVAGAGLTDSCCVKLDGLGIEILIKTAPEIRQGLVLNLDNTVGQR